MTAAAEAGKRHGYDPDRVHEDPTFELAMRRLRESVATYGAWRQLALFGD